MTDKKLQEIEARKKLTEPVEEFFKAVGYKARSAPITKEFMAKPSFYGKREGYTIAVYTLLDARALSVEIPRVKTVTFQMGKDVDYVLLLPQQDESKLIELLCANEDKDYKRIMKEGFILCMWDAEKKMPMTFFNLPKDEMVRKQIEDRGDIVVKARGA